jgi:putative hydrolase of the HAD superfamily
MARTAAVFFDVDFTLIHPGPRFQASGYHECCARHGMTVDPAAFEAAVAGAASVLDSSDALYNPAIFVRFTRRIIELMGGTGPQVDVAAQELYDEWAHHHHFSLYDDVPDALAALHRLGVRLGLISNGHRCLTSFQSHFELDGLIDVTISPADQGFLKPHPAIFKVALDRMGVRPDEAVMVGDSLAQDVIGARQAGMRGILIARGGTREPVDADIEVIQSLHELPARMHDDRAA